MIMSRKGISPLIAAILLIAFTITVATFLASWSTSFARTQTEEFERAGKEITAECQYANLQIETAIFDDSDEKVVAVVWNMGKTELSNFQFLVYYSEVNISTLTPTDANKTLSTGDFYTFTVENVTDTPEKIQVRSLYCPRESIFTCLYSAGKFNC